MEKGRGPENYTAFVSIPDTTTPTISPQQKQCCLNQFQMSSKMETLIAILMFLTLVHKGPLDRLVS